MIELTITTKYDYTAGCTKSHYKFGIFGEETELPEPVDLDLLERFALNGYDYIVVHVDYNSRSKTYTLEPFKDFENRCKISNRYN